MRFIMHSTVMRRSRTWMSPLLCACMLLTLSALAQSGATSTRAVDAGMTAGTKLTVRLNEKLQSGKSTVGQMWTGTLVNSISRDGTVTIPQGSTVTGTVTESKDSGRIKAPGVLSIQLVSVNQVPVSTDVITRDGEGHTKSNTTKVGGGAAGGALIGGLAGGGTGAGIGALAGAGAGVIGALATGKRQAKLDPETTLTFTVQ